MTGSRRSWVVACIALLVAFFAMVAFNTIYPGYIDHAEPNIVAVAWLVLKGSPLYHAIDAPDRYSLLYGPSSFLGYAAALWVGGPSIYSLKVAVALTNVATTYFLWRAYRAELDRVPALLVLVLVLGLLLFPRPNTYQFQLRADAFMICAVSGGLWAASARKGWLGPVMLALAAAFTIDAKASGFVYFMPIFVRFAEHRGRRVALLTAAGTVAASLFPFLLPNVSLRLYLTWFFQSARHPRVLLEAIKTARAIALTAVPFVMITGVRFWRSPAVMSHVKASRLTLLALAVGLAFVSVLSSKLGAGPHHILPFVPTLGLELVRLYRAAPPRWWADAPARFQTLCALLAIAGLARIAGGFAETHRLMLSEWQRAVAVRADLRDIVAANAGRRVDMGYGEREDVVTFYRPLLVYESNRLLLDDQAMYDMQIGSIPVPRSTIDAIAACEVDTFLIPKGQAPFRLLNAYHALAPKIVPPVRVFPPALSDAFERTYHREGTSVFFDLWSCDRRRR